MKKLFLIMKRIISVLIIMFVALGTFFFEYVSSFFPWITENQFHGLAFLLILAYLKIIHDDIRALRINSKEIFHTDLANGLHYILKNTPQIDTLRIYASSSAKILSIISTSNIRIKNCKILIHKMDANDLRSQSFNQRILMTINEWQELNNNRKIDVLSIKCSISSPAFHLIIVEEKYLLYGNYLFTDISTRVSVEEPYLILNTCKELDGIFQKHKNWFDSMFESDSLETF